MSLNRQLSPAHSGDTQDASFPTFDLDVAPGGYAWWYLDALSDDGNHGLTLIAFLGSVFSPYYAWARRRNKPEPLNHCAVNIALYGRGGKRWALTERGRSAVRRTPESLVIGPSGLNWDGHQLIIDFDEVTVPLPGRLRGQIRLQPSTRVSQQFTLDANGRHVWWPVAPAARVEVALDAPNLSWCGEAYLDHNKGTEPLEASFLGWDWSRAAEPDGTRILYDLRRRDSSNPCLALQIEESGQVHTLPEPALTALPSTGWRVKRWTRIEPGQAFQRIETLEDTPFYARSLLTTSRHGKTQISVHESLSMERFQSPLVQAMLPFRMPRRAHWPRSDGKVQS